MLMLSLNIWNVCHRDGKRISFLSIKYLFGIYPVVNLNLMSLENLFISLEAIYFIMRECPRVVLRTLGPRCSLIGLRSRRRVTPEGDKGQTVNPNCLKFLRAVDNEIGTAVLTCWCISHHWSVLSIIPTKRTFPNGCVA